MPTACNVSYLHNNILLLETQPFPESGEFCGMFSSIYLHFLLQAQLSQALALRVKSWNIFTLKTETIYKLLLKALSDQHWKILNQAVPMNGCMNGSFVALSLLRHKAFLASKIFWPFLFLLPDL